MNKKFVGITIVLAAAMAAGAWYWSRPVANDTELVLYGNVDLRQVALAFPASERVVRVLAEEGQKVQAGQVLAELDTRGLRLRLAEAEAQAAAQQQVLARLKAGTRVEEVAQARARTGAAQADAELARQQMERALAVQQDSNGRAISQQDVDAARARATSAQAALEQARQGQQLAQHGARREDIAQAQAQLDAAHAAIALLQYQLGEAALKAPVDAVVRARLMEAGDMASPQRPVYTLAMADPKWVRTYVREADLGRIKPGMAASISIDSQPGRTLAGKVGYISSVAEFTPKTVQTEELRTALVYEVRVLAEDKADVLRMGMPATVRIAAGR
ncbi:HlyD family secretion protein [Duganella sp. CF458]|uniref:HlyD family efflux transporter periplasmic adaptor subunit n=1 Tax=Duganella sp. CF458 TaxID=1884368 RepID=UPI0008E86571|nr:HlyD family efflux transporter periplasmic adaptor subunit [Duganella sp. CF458]SFG03967.1 HlyD family secretion protein [Duganella sp. CF458]